MTQNEEEKGRVSFNPVLLNLQATPGGEARLMGSHCSSCGNYFFPKQALCTECSADASLQDVPLGTRGTLYTYTVVERESLAPKGFQVPYVYGYVDLPEGVRVLSKIVGWTPETLKLGARVEFMLEEIRQDPSGEKVMGFRFGICS